VGRIKGVPHLRGKKRKKKWPYTAGEQFNYQWHEHEVIAFISLYNELRASGNDSKDLIWFLAKRFKRNETDVAILIMDLGERDMLNANGATARRFSMEVMNDD
jgi:hypothetical protein